MSSWMTAMKDNPVASDSGAVSDAPAVPPAKPAAEIPPAPHKEAPKPAEAKVDPNTPQPPTPPEPTDEKWPRTSADWKKFKEARAKEQTAYETKLKEYETKVAELSKQPAAPSDYEAIKKQAEEYSGIISQISVENHPKFKAYYDGAVANQIEMAKQLVGSENAGAVADILGLPDGNSKNEKIDELFATLTPSQQARLGGIVNQISNIQAERGREIQKSKETYAVMQKQKQDEATAKMKTFETMFDSETKKLQAEHPAFQKRDGDDAWNADVDQRIETTKKYLFGNDMKPEQIIRAAADAVALPAILKQNLALLEKAEALEKQVAELSGASPRIASDKSSEAPAASNGEKQTVKAPAGSRPMEVMSAWIKNMPSLGR